MNESLYFAMFIILMAMVLIWFGLCIWTFRRLEKAHPQKYLEMGKPSLFLRNNIENGWLFLKFLWRSEYMKLGDSRLAGICSFMKIFFVIYCVLFVSMIAIFFSITPKPE